MIDFVKILVEEYDGRQLMRHPLLKFIGKFEESTGDAFNTYTVTFKDLKFIIHESDDDNKGKPA